MTILIDKCPAHVVPPITQSKIRNLLTPFNKNYMQSTKEILGLKIINMCFEFKQFRWKHEYINLKSNLDSEKHSSN